MNRFHAVTMGLILSLAEPHIASAQAPPNSEPAGNAALQYWQAFAQMPTLDQDQEKLLETWQTVPLDAPAIQLINASRSSRMFLHRAAKIPRCDWGLDYNDGIGLLLPHLARARDLARLTALHARHEFERGNPGAARDDAVALMVLARHVGHDPIMISLLVRYKIEETVVDLVAPYLPELKAPHAQSVSIFQSLPPAVPMSQTILTERDFIAVWLIRHLREAELEKKGAWKTIWMQVLSDNDIPDSVRQIATLDEAQKLVEDLLPVYDKLRTIVALPKAEFDAQYTEFKQTVTAGNPLARALLPAVDKFLGQEQRNQTRMAMLLAAIAVVQDGPDTLKDINDPFGSGPFEYRALEKGFELKSALIVEGKPVTLTVGHAPNDLP